MRMLIVEDDRLLNHTLCYNLLASGYFVDAAMTKAAAAQFILEHDYDLVVLDVNLPDGSGFDLCNEVKERYPDTAVIFLTARDMESDQLPVLSRSVSSFLWGVHCSFPARNGSFTI